MKELVIKKCLKCGAIVKVIQDCHCEECGINCCGKTMHTIKSNSSDGAIEKHKPTYTIENNKIVATVNHVMEDNHYIEYLCLLTDNREEYVYFQPGDKPIATFNNAKSGTIYAYCNTHGLWKTVIE